ncbi:MAG: hypothetical protein JNL05_00645 [Flavobacteriales bacterium]|nr:hypothetical protein [Flavobacteriales bacterium]
MRKDTIGARLRALYLLVLVLTLVTGTARGQDVVINGPSTKGGHIDLSDLVEETTDVQGQGEEVPGEDLGGVGKPRHAIGDDSTYAARAFVDTTWAYLQASADSVLPGNSVHWVRYHLRPDEDLAGVPLYLVVEVRGPFAIFHNGKELFWSSGTRYDNDGRLLPRSDSVPVHRVPVRFSCDGIPEVFALRMELPAGRPIKDAALEVSLHPADEAYRMHRSMLHYGVFIGVNAIILVLSLVIWWGDRRVRSWLLLALLSLVSMVDTVCELGAGDRALGFSDGTVQALHIISLVIMSWPMYLLIMVLGVLRGDLTPKRVRWYTASVVVLTLLCSAGAWLEVIGVLDTLDGLSFTDIAEWLIVVMIVLVLLFGLVFTFLAIEVLRLGIRLLRAKGYERWVGAGAVASLLLTLVLKVVGDLSDTGIGSFFSVLGDYCSYVAVPLSIAIYMAIRAAHHNRLVARQRDELDAEVKERTAELRSEKERSDELLLNILPAEVAEELKAKGAAAAKHFDQATVLFTDFRGFTQMSEQVGPAELVQELNACFKEFDAIMGRYRIEKIKTIGDSYMAAGGLPDPTHGGPVDVVRAALEMQAFMTRHQQERRAGGLPVFEMRVGIHTGPVVAGIVGVKKFQYDIWGDTVNTASRMESSGEIGKVNISGATYALVKDTAGLTFLPRGRVQAKGKGELEMWFVEQA